MEGVEVVKRVSSLCGGPLALAPTHDESQSQRLLFALQSHFRTWETQAPPIQGL